MSIVSGKLGGNISVTGSGIQQGYASLLLSYNFFAKYDNDGREVPLLTLKDQVITTTVDGIGDLKDVEIVIPKTVVMDGDIEFTLEGSFTFDAVKQSVSLTKNSLKLTAVDKDSSRDFTDEFSYTLKSSDFTIVDSEGNAITDFEIGQTEVEVFIDGELGREVTVSYKVGEIYINGTKMSDEVEGVSTTVADLNGKLIQNIVIPYKVIIDEYTGLEGNINITTSNEVDAYFTASFKAFDDYDITTVKRWIPDARQWNDDVAVSENIDVLSISNGTFTYTVGGKQSVGKIENENLVTADRLMNNMYNLKTVNCNFPELKCGLQMFSNCGNLTTVNTDLSSLETGRDLFFMCGNLNTISLTSLDKLINGSRMFQSCKKITNFSYDLPNLKSGRGMFEGCSSLTNFSGSLGNLLCGYNMFTGCKLNKQSVLNIAESIKDISQIDKEDDSQWQVWSYWYENKQYSDTPELQYRGVINIDTADGVTLDDAEVVEALNNMTAKKGWTVLFNSETYVPNIIYNYASSLYLSVDEKDRVSAGKITYDNIFRGVISIDGQRPYEQNGQITYDMEVSYSEGTVEPTNLVFDISPSNTPDNGSFGQVTKTFMIRDYEMEVAIHSVGEEVKVGIICKNGNLRIRLSETEIPDDPEEPEEPADDVDIT